MQTYLDCLEKDLPEILSASRKELDTLLRDTEELVTLLGEGDSPRKGSRREIRDS